MPWPEIEIIYSLFNVYPKHNVQTLNVTIIKNNQNNCDSRYDFIYEKILIKVIIKK